MFSSSYSSCNQSPTDGKPISPRSLPKKKFTEEDDQKLREIIARIGTSSWIEVAKAMGDRNSRQCKERWENYLDPTINTSPWTQEEDDLLIQKQLEIGSKWVTIAHFFNRRTDAQVKNRWQMLDRKMKKMQKAKTVQSSTSYVSPPQPQQVNEQEPSIQFVRFEQEETFDDNIFDDFSNWDLDLPFSETYVQDCSLF